MLMKARKWTVVIEDTGETFLCAEDQHLLQGMLSMGKRGIPSGCHGGGCGICKVRISSGKAEYGPMSRAHVSEEEERQGYALACRVYPRSDMRLKVIGKMGKNVLKPKRKYGFV